MINCIDKIIMAIGTILEVLFVVVIIQKLKESVSNQEEIIRLLKENNIEENPAGNVSDIVKSKEFDEYIENAYDITDENFAVVSIKLLSDFQRKADIKNNVFIRAQKEKKYVANMKKGEVIKFKVPVGKCRISVGNKIIPLIDSICIDVSRDKTEVVGIKYTILGYILLSGIK